MDIDLLAVLPAGLEDAGVIELSVLGAKNVRKAKGRISCKVDLASFYRLHLQARLPFRFLREIKQFPCNGKDSLYKGIQDSCDWEKWLDPSKTFRVNVSGGSIELNHTHFTALTVKNAVVDLQETIWGQRSAINLKSPDLCIHVHIFSEGAILSFDTSATSLHRRGYREAMGSAPLKENLAAGLIKLSTWDDSLTLFDPLCGSGTFLIEAVSMALSIPTGLFRSFLFEKWPDFDRELWKLESTLARELCSLNKKLPPIIGCEKNIEIAKQAEYNISLAGLENYINIKNVDFLDFQLPKVPGVIVCNPPYGQRLGNPKDLEFIYRELGNYLKKNASGWDLWLLSGNSQLSNFLGMKCSRRFPITNGGIDCRWLHYKIH